MSPSTAGQGVRGRSAVPFCVTSMRAAAQPNLPFLDDRYFVMCPLFKIGLARVDTTARGTKSTAVTSAKGHPPLRRVAGWVGPVPAGVCSGGEQNSVQSLSGASSRNVRPASVQPLAAYSKDRGRSRLDADLNRAEKPHGVRPIVNTRKQQIILNGADRGHQVWSSAWGNRMARPAIQSYQRNFTDLATPVARP
jgi:hypothetical protein